MSNITGNFYRVVAVVGMSPIVRFWDLGLQMECRPWGVFSKGSQPVFARVSEKTTENSDRLGRQARPEFEPGNSRFPVLSVTAVPLVGLLQFGLKLLNCISSKLTELTLSILYDLYTIHTQNTRLKKFIKCVRFFWMNWV